MSNQIANFQPVAIQYNDGTRVPYNGQAQANPGQFPVALIDANGQMQIIPNANNPSQGYNPPQTGGPVDLAGGIAGQQAGQSIVNAVRGGPASGLPPAAPNIVPPAVANPGLGAAAFDPNFTPSQYLAEGGNGYQLPTQLGADGVPTYAADQLTGAAPIQGGIANTGYGAAAMPYLAPAAVAAIGAYTAKKGIDAFNDSQYSAGNPVTGFKKGLEDAGPLKFVPLLGQVPAIAGAVGAFFGSGKDEAQHKRDVVRKSLQGGGLVDANWDLTLPDGTKFNIGKDGHYKMDNGLHPYQVDFGQEGASDIVGAVNPLAALASKGDSKLTSDFAGYFTNALLNSKDKEKNILGLYQQAGLDRDSALKMISELPVSDDKKAAYSSAVDTIFKGKPLQHAPTDLVAAAPHFQNGVQQAAPKPAAANTQPAAPVIQKDPNTNPNKLPVNTSTVQKPVPPKGALSLNGWQRPGIMANNPPGKRTLFGGGSG